MKQLIKRWLGIDTQTERIAYLEALAMEQSSRTRLHQQQIKTITESSISKGEKLDNPDSVVYILETRHGWEPMDCEIALISTSALKCIEFIRENRHFLSVNDWSWALLKTTLDKQQTPELLELYNPDGTQILGWLKPSKL